jgi:hypothetical protein
MGKRILCLVLVGALFSLSGNSSVLASVKEKEADSGGRVKSAIAKLGTGPDARVQVKLRDGTKLKGYIKEATDEHFIVVNEKTGAAAQILYPQVKTAKGNNLTTGAKIAIVVGVILAVALIVGSKVG